MPTVYSSIVYDSVRVYDGLKIRQSGGIVTEYTEEGLHRPYAPLFFGTRSDGTQLFEFSSVAPHIGEETSVLRLPFTVIVDETIGNGSGRAIMDRLERMRFIDISYINSFGNSAVIYGWVDGYRITGSGGPQSTVEIRWHPDHYLSFPNAAYGTGRILRGPAELARPDPSEPRMWIEDSNTQITDNNDREFWVVVLYTDNHKVDDDHVYTQYQLAFWQNESVVSSHPTPSIFDVYNGLLEEYLELDPDAIRGAWVSPIRPMDPSSPGVTVQTDSGSNRSWYKARPALVEQTSFTVDADPVMTEDSEKWEIVDPTGGILATVPWGLPFDKIYMTLDIGPAGCYLMTEFRDSSQGRTYGEGRMFSIPLISVPVTQNALQSYVYSGEREYDKTLRTIQKDQAAINGIAGIGQQAIGGAVAGTMAAGPAGLAAGAVAGVISGAVGTAVGYFSADYFDRKTQAAIDKLKSNQAAGDVVSAGGLAWYYNGGQWRLLKMVRDDVSAAELAADHDELGYPTDSYSANCTSLISNGGGLRIESLEVKGVGPAGQRYISSLFARGVHIDIPNP